jgi:carbamoyl-phosphate synthase large subunit
MPQHAPMSVKEAVLPFKRFRTRDGRVVDSLLGPEMRSTGEVMGIDADFGRAFAKSQLGAIGGLPTEGTVFVSVANRDKRGIVFPIKRLADLGFRIISTTGTAQVLRRNGIDVEVIGKHAERAPGEQSIVDLINAGEVDLVINTPSGPSARADGYAIRAATTAMDKPIVTTVQQVGAAVQAIEAIRAGGMGVKSLQEHAHDLDLYGAGGRR